MFDASHGREHEQQSESCYEMFAASHFLVIDSS